MKNNVLIDVASVGGRQKQPTFIGSEQKQPASVYGNNTSIDGQQNPFDFPRAVISLKRIDVVPWENDHGISGDN